MITTECEEMQVTGLLVAIESTRHRESAYACTTSKVRGAAHILPGLRIETWGTRRGVPDTEFIPLFFVGIGKHLYSTLSRYPKMGSPPYRGARS